MFYKATRLHKVTKEKVVAALQPLRVLGLIPMDQAHGKHDGDFEDDGVWLQLLDNIELHDGGKYIAIFNNSPLDSQVCK